MPESPYTRGENIAHTLLFMLTYALIVVGVWAVSGVDPAQQLVNMWYVILNSVAHIVHLFV